MTTLEIGPETAERTQLRRYPGARSFEEWDQTQFRGRKRATEELLLRVLSVRLLLQFAPSGVGKTSLLNAGLFPRLRTHNYFPFIVRVNQLDETLIQAVRRAMRDAAHKFALVDPIIPEGAQSLWELIAGTQLWSRDLLLLTPILVFDQFEEIFTLRDPEFRRMFAEEMGELASGAAHRVPVQGAAAVSAEGIALPAFKIIMSLREEYLGKLEEFSASIPDLFRERLRLPPLSNSEAKEAIVEPARLPGSEWISPAFEYQADCLEALIEFIDDVSVSVKIVDSLTLQLVCQRAETIAMQRKVSVGGQATLTLHDFGGRDGLERLVRDYYLKELAKLPDATTRRRAQEMFEEGLLDPNGKRLMLEVGEIERKFRLKQPTLDQLIAGSLLRREPRNESVFYEISHDRLTETIAKNRKPRLPRWVLPTIAAGAVIMIIVSGLGMRAHLKGVEARRARDQAEYMLELLLSEDLVSRLRDSGLTEELKSLLPDPRSGDLVAEYGRVPAEVLKWRHEGDIERDQGTLKAARDNYTRALTVLDHADRGSGSTQLMLDAERARILQRQGSLMVDAGTLAQAEKNYRSSIELWQSVLKDSDRLLDSLDAAQTRLEFGDLRFRLGDHEGALSEALEANRLAMKVSRTAYQQIRPGFFAANFELDRAFQISADAALRMFNYEEDKATGKAAIALAHEAVRRQPFSYQARQEYATAIVNSELTDDSPDGWAPLLERSRRQFDNLVRSDPNNLRIQREYAALQVVTAQRVSYCAIDPGCKTKLPGGAVDEATTATIESIGTFRMLAGLDAENRSLTDDVAWGLQTLARLRSAGPNSALTLSTLDAAIETARAAKVDVRDFNNVARIAMLLEDKGRVQQDAGRRTEALASWDSALAELDRMPAESDTTAGYRQGILNYKIALLRQNHQENEAAQLQKQSDQIGANYKSPWMARSRRAGELNKEGLQLHKDFKPQGGMADVLAYRQKADKYDQAIAEDPFESAYWWNTGQAQTEIADGAKKLDEAATTPVSANTDAVQSAAHPNAAMREAALNEALFALWMGEVLAPETESAKYSKQVYEKRRSLAIFLHDSKRDTEARVLAADAAKDAEEFVRSHRDTEARAAAPGPVKPAKTAQAPPRNPDESSEALFYLADANFGVALTRASMARAGWEEAYEVAIIYGQQLANLEPTKAERQTWLGNTLMSFADQLQDEKQNVKAARQGDLALKACSEARQLAQPSSTESKEAEDCLANLATRHY